MRERSLTERFIQTGKAMAMAYMAARTDPADQLHLRILGALRLQPELRQSQLLYLLDVPYSTLEEALGDLEYDGYLRRSREGDPAVSLTDRGEEAAARPPRDDTDTMFDCLDQEEQELLAGYLERIEDRLADGAEDRRFDRDLRHSGGWMARAALFREKISGHFGPRYDTVRKERF